MHLKSLEFCQPKRVGTLYNWNSYSVRVFKPRRAIALNSASWSRFLAEAKINGNFHSFSDILDIVLSPPGGLKLLYLAMWLIHKSELLKFYIVQLAAIFTIKSHHISLNLIKFHHISLYLTESCQISPNLIESQQISPYLSKLNVRVGVDVWQYYKVLGVQKNPAMFII